MIISTRINLPKQLVFANNNNDYRKWHAISFAERALSLMVNKPANECQPFFAHVTHRNKPMVNFVFKNLFESDCNCMFGPIDDSNARNSRWFICQKKWMKKPWKSTSTTINLLNGRGKRNCGNIEKRCSVQWRVIRSRALRPLTKAIPNKGRLVRLRRHCWGRWSFKSILVRDSSIHISSAYTMWCFKRMWRSNVLLSH